MNISIKIHTIREVQIILDRDLAEIYEVPTKQLNLAVKRNIKRFPEDFMFKLNENEVNLIDISQNNLRFQNETLESKRGKHRKYLPNAFTEQGVAMLSGILNSKKSVEINIQIMRAFISMRKFILSNAQIFQRLNTHELKLIEHDKQFKKIFNDMQSKIPNKGIFFDGQIFDAYSFISDLIRSANSSIILIDNYVDDSVLTLFSKTKVKSIIYTKEITKQLKLDLEKYNQQYNNIEIKEFNLSHDRFIIIDNQTYHIGASLKDLGKKWFAFSRFDKDALKLLNKLKNKK